MTPPKNDDDAAEGELLPAVEGGELVPYADFEKYLATSDDSLAEDPEVAQRRIIEQIIASKSMGEAMAETTALHARDLLNEPLTVHGFKIAKGDFEDGMGYFAIIDATVHATGERVVITCGATNVLAQLYVGQRTNGFPVDGRFAEPEKATARGYKPLWLRPLDTF